MLALGPWPFQSQLFESTRGSRGEGTVRIPVGELGKRVGRSGEVAPLALGHT